MSSDIWTRCAGSSRLRPLAARPWRVVEAQHLVSTRKLVDSAEDQALLEQLIEQGKPPIPAETDFENRHFLLTASFRYPPLPHGSRFATRHERSLWYGARARSTAFAEVTYYRLLFLEGTAADLDPLIVEVSAFQVPVRSRDGIDLTRPPFDAYEARISSPASYGDSQRLGRAMREAGVEVFRYRSARDPERGTCLALFTPRAFAVSRPGDCETWVVAATKARVEFQRKDFFDRTIVRFARESFLIDGRLPEPAP